eukprot:6161652-Amphidinium_carterae.1
MQVCTHEGQINGRVDRKTSLRAIIPWTPCPKSTCKLQLLLEQLRKQWNVSPRSFCIFSAVVPTHARHQQRHRVGSPASLSSLRA